MGSTGVPLLWFLDPGYLTFMALVGIGFLIWRVLRLFW